MVPKFLSIKPENTYSFKKRHPSCISWVKTVLKYQTCEELRHRVFFSYIIIKEKRYTGKDHRLQCPFLRERRSTKMSIQMSKLFFRFNRANEPSEGLLTTGKRDGQYEG